MEGDVFYYVLDGDICSGHVLGVVTIQVEKKGHAPYRKEILSHVLHAEIPTAPEDGTYMLMTGMKVIKKDDLHPTAKDAANAYRDQLITGYYNDRVR